MPCESLERSRRAANRARPLLIPVFVVVVVVVRRCRGIEDDDEDKDKHEDDKGIRNRSHK
jgi:hypothetical protein